MSSGTGIHAKGEGALVADNVVVEAHRPIVVNKGQVGENIVIAAGRIE